MDRRLSSAGLGTVLTISAVSPREFLRETDPDRPRELREPGRGPPHPAGRSAGRRRRLWRICELSNPARRPRPRDPDRAVGAERHSRAGHAYRGPLVPDRLLHVRGIEIVLLRHRCPPDGESCSTEHPRASAIGRPARDERPPRPACAGEVGARTPSTMACWQLPITTRDCCGSGTSFIRRAETDRERVAESLPEGRLEGGGPGVLCRPDPHYARATLAVTRARATTLAELACVGIPAILVPRTPPMTTSGPTPGSLNERGPASSSTRRTALPGTVRATLHRRAGFTNRLDRMGEAMQGLAKPQAADAVADPILSLVRVKV